MDCIPLLYVTLREAKGLVHRVRNPYHRRALLPPPSAMGTALEALLKVRGLSVLRFQQMVLKPVHRFHE